MKALITGGAGFIGSHLAEELISRGQKVLIIDDLSTGRLDNISHLIGKPDFQYVIDTILNYSAMDKLISQSDCVYHLAAAVGVRLIMEKPVQTIKTNVRGTEIVLEIANKYKRKVLITSTSEVYGKNASGPMKEDDDRVLGSTKKLRWAYANSKTFDEFLGLAYYKEKKLPVIIARLFNTVGPRQSDQYGMVIPNFVRNALLGKQITVYGDGKQSRSFGYVGDIVWALAELMAHPGAVGEIFNVGNGEEITIGELAKRVKEITNSSSEIVNVEYHEAYGEGFEDMQRRVPDLDKIKKLINYEPTMNLDGILKKVIQHFKE